MAGRELRHQVGRDWHVAEVEPAQPRRRLRQAAAFVVEHAATELERREGRCLQDQLELRGGTRVERERLERWRDEHGERGRVELEAPDIELGTRTGA